MHSGDKHQQEKLACMLYCTLAYILHSFSREPRNIEISYLKIAPKITEKTGLETETKSRDSITDNKESLATDRFERLNFEQLGYFTNAFIFKDFIKK